MKIRYTIEKFKLEGRHNYIYKVFKNVTSLHGIASRKLYEGTYTNCKRFLKTIKGV